MVKPAEGGLNDVQTPGRGFCQIKGLDDFTARAVANAINRAYDNGGRDARRTFRESVGIFMSEED